MPFGSKTDASIRTDGLVRGVVESVFSSLSIQLFLLGIVFIVAGYLKQIGPLAAMLSIWGGALVIIGVVSYVMVWNTRY